MQGRDFVSKLKAIKREVLALKQAHEYGLGSANFFYEFVYVDTPPASVEAIDLRLTIVYDMDGTEQPFQTVYVVNEEIYGATWNGPAKTYTVAYSETNLLGRHSASVVATQPIKSMTLERI